MRVRKFPLTSLLFTGGLLAISASPLAADAVITFFDLNDNLSVTIEPSSRVLDANCFGEICDVTLSDPSLGAFPTNLRGPQGPLNPFGATIWIAEPGNNTVSDAISFLGGRFFFFSDDELGVLGGDVRPTACAAAGGCQITEDGTIQ